MTNEELTTALEAEKASHKETQQKLRAAKDVQLVAEIRAGPMRLEAVRHRHFDGTEGKVTFSMMFDNDLMAHMGEQSALCFANFVRDTLEGRHRD